MARKHAAPNDAGVPERTGSARAKVRADQLLVDKGLSESRTRAQALILAGLVYCGDKRVDKAGQQVAAESDISVRGKDHPWVSRGGLKLAHALRHFEIDVSGMTAIDVGSSTGGFTDVLLANGAEQVFAVDSGTNQLAWKLRQDRRVTVHEKTSARVLTEEHITHKVDLVVCDASFISLAKVLEKPLSFLLPGGLLVALIKPQFEAGREEVGKGGVVRDANVHQRVCDQVANWLCEIGFVVSGVVKSPIEGPSGNVEFLIAARLSS